MNAPLTIGLLCCGLAACGAERDDTTVTEGGLPPDAAEALLVDTLDWHGQQISFHDLSGPSDTVPALLVSTLGDSSSRDLYDVLNRQALYEPTPAEIWRAIRGEADIPEELLAQHVWQVEAEGRPEGGFQDFDLKTVDKAVPNFSSLFPLDTTSTGLADPSQRCWTDGGLRFKSDTSGSMCSANGNFVRPFDIPTDCGALLNVNETLRTGTFNGGGAGSYLGKTCGATGNPGTWSCTSNVVITLGMYFASTLAKNGSPHRMGTGFHVAPGVGATNAYLGSAILASGLRRFEDTSCHGFTKNF